MSKRCIAFFIMAFMTVMSITTIFANNSGLIYGDANNDGKITVADAAEVLQKVLNSGYQTQVDKDNPENMKNILDVTADNMITAADAASILNKALNSDFIFPVEKKSETTTESWLDDDTSETTTGNESDDGTSETTTNSGSDDGTSETTTEAVVDYIKTETKLTQDVHYSGDLIISDDVDLNGYSLIVDGNIIQEEGKVSISGGKLSVGKNYRIQSISKDVNSNIVYDSAEAWLNMSNTADYVLVNGSFITYSHTYGYQGNKFTAGTLEVKGNFYQYGGGHYIGFNTSESHKTILSGTEKQIIHFDYPQYNGFNELQITNNPNNIDFDGTKIRGFKADSMIIFNHSLEISNGTLYINGQNVVINGNLDLSTDAYMTGGILDISGDLFHHSGCIHLNRGALIVEGNYKIQDFDVQEDGTIDAINSSGYIKMAYDEDIVKISNDFIVQSNNRSTLTNGTIEIGGNFIQKKTQISDNFYSSKNHVIILNGNGTQTITFESPSRINEHINSDGSTTEDYSRYSQFNYLITNKDISNYNFKPAQRQFISSNGTNTNYYALIYNSTLVNADARVTFGRAGVSPASGNYSETFSDMEIPAAGVGIDFGRTYNSMDNADAGLMGTGWHFSYSSKIEGTDDTKTVTLPNGSVNYFELKNGSYSGTNTRNVLMKNDSGYTLTNKDQSAYVFNNNGYLSAVKDKYGNQVSIDVDENGKISKLTDQSGYTYTITYAGGYISSIKDDKSGISVSYGYDGDKLISFTDVMGCVSTFEYNDKGKLCTIKNNDGYAVEQLTYVTEEGSNQNKILTRTDRSGNKTTYSYDTNERCTTMTDSNGRVTKQYYDSCYNTTKTIDAEGGVETIAYFLNDKGQSIMGEVRSKTDRNGNTTTNTIDDRGNITKITYPDGSTSQYIYDSKNNLTQETDQEGRKTFYVYDSTGVYLEKMVVPYDTASNYSGDDTHFAVTKYTYYDNGTYKANGLAKTETTPMGAVTTLEYYTDGTLKSQSTASGGRTVTESYTYNSQRLAEKHTDKNGNVTEYSYDKRGNIIKESKGNGTSVSRTVYNKNGEKIQEIAPSFYNSSYDNLSTGAYSDTNAGIRYVYNKDGTLAQQTDANGNVTKYTYDVYGNTLTETQPNGLVYKYTYDKIDRKIKTEADGIGIISTISYKILSNGNTQTTTTNYIDDKNTAVTVQTMDYADRLISQQNPDSTTIKNTYDKSGRQITSTDAKGNTTMYTYNFLGLKEQEKIPFEVKDGTTYYNILKYEYDKNGNNTCIYKSVNAVGEGEKYSKTEYTFDGFDRLAAVKSYTDSSTIGNVVQYYYDNAGNKIRMYTGLYSPLTISDADSVSGSDSDYSVDKYTYDFNGNILSHTDSLGYLESYKYDADGKVISYTDKNGNITSYQYDKNGNIILTKGKDYSYSYEYNSMNNRVSASDGNINGSYTYDKLGRMTGESINNSTKTYTYDRIGNMITKNQNGTATTYNFDSLNRLSSVAGESNCDYKYDFDNQRLSKGNTNFIWSNGKLAAEYDESNNINFVYSYGVDRISRNSDYYVHNAHTDVVASLNSEGDVNKFYSYDEFGIEEDIFENDANPFRYVGEYYDNETGNYYLSNRYYNPLSGRFISEDSYTGDEKLSVSFNRYTYCNNNPIMYIDSNGNKAIVIQKVAGKAVTGWLKVNYKNLGQTLEAKLTGKENKTSVTDYSLSFLSSSISAGFSAVDMGDLGKYTSQVINQNYKEFKSSKSENRKFSVENVAKNTVYSVAESSFKSALKAGVTGVWGGLIGILANTAVGMVKDLAMEAFNPGCGAIANNPLVKTANWFTTKSRTAKAYNYYIENEYTSEFAMKHGYRNEFMAVKDLSQAANWGIYMIQNTTSKNKLMNYDQWREANNL